MNSDAWLVSRFVSFPSGFKFLLCSAVQQETETETEINGRRAVAVQRTVDNAEVQQQLLVVKQVNSTVP